ncbi:MAG: hypothetical protein IPH08_10595 [Rhodocyclaceae bacterium]|nr:hypothetical protein [Rhodocyclaceae bacterium]
MNIGLVIDNQHAPGARHLHSRLFNFLGEIDQFIFHEYSLLVQIVGCLLPTLS